MAKRVPELSIFFPFWDEQENIETVIDSAISVAEKFAVKWEIIMVDDGSMDDTLSIAKKLATKDSRLKVVTHTPNRGYGAALRAGFEKSRYELVAFTDGDGQFDISEIERFLKKIEHSDIVIGFRKKRSDKNIIKRLLLMNLLKVWDLLLFRFYFRDIDCGFKMFRKAAINKISPLRSEGAMITTEILAKAKRKKLKIMEIGVTHYPRTKGHQSGANFPVIVRAVLESWVLWYDLHYGRT
jgi:glycosyltransferase involved in cell wall biosynthesis